MFCEEDLKIIHYKLLVTIALFKSALKTLVCRQSTAHKLVLIIL